VALYGESPSAEARCAPLEGMRRLSVVIPVYNARDHIAQTIDAAVNAIDRAPSFAADVVLVDDGSSDGSAALAEAACAGRLPLRLIVQPNRGRFEARRVGVEAAEGDWILLLDSRLTLAPDALQFIAARIELGEHVWTCHVQMEVDRDPSTIRALRASDRPTSTVSQRAPHVSSCRADCCWTRLPRFAAGTPTFDSRTTTGP
jgi:glycosyltransferase involved in cell wall biosynthesis